MVRVQYQRSCRRGVGGMDARVGTTIVAKNIAIHAHEIATLNQAKNENYFWAHTYWIFIRLKIEA